MCKFSQLESIKSLIDTLQCDQQSQEDVCIKSDIMKGETWVCELYVQVGPALTGNLVLAKLYFMRNVQDWGGLLQNKIHQRLVHNLLDPYTYESANLYIINTVIIYELLC